VLYIELGYACDDLCEHIFHPKTAKLARGRMELAFEHRVYNQCGSGLGERRNLVLVGDMEDHKEIVKLFLTRKLFIVFVERGSIDITKHSINHDIRVARHSINT
jgi:hypothetical protein